MCLLHKVGASVMGQHMGMQAKMLNIYQDDDFFFLVHMHI